MTPVILQKLNPIVLEKLKYLAQSHQRTLEEEITSILEDITENTPIITPQNRGWFPGFLRKLLVDGKENHWLGSIKQKRRREIFCQDFSHLW
ncbi:hypothetical protein [Cylindrospermopsis raciborskii]|uniref:hypothetical protein n=1 Tax=Cylindrospermopsis raciborskii TaxID=77022 RepID=UPI0001C170D0|nr:hypothetical protein [Cylindrospermopsis raciborskii]EFA68960.1 hypothetical protein CRC_02511 [Cylindrospermopsis raciborskii CS-505]